MLAHRRLVCQSLVVFAAFTAAARGAEESLLGRQVDDFTLRDFHGNEHALSAWKDSKLVVVAVVGTECPLVKLYAPRLASLAEEFAGRGVAFVGIDSNVQDSPTEMAAFARNFQIKFPLLKDAGNAIADRLGAARTPEVFVLDASRKIRYRGRIDDQYGVGYHRTAATRRDLAVALDELLADKDVSVPATEASGCLIGRVRKVESKGDVTFSNQIARVFNRRCVECHRAGELAPFPLTDYAEAAGWGPMIAEVVRAGRMPPWFADARHGKFANDASLTDEEKQLIVRWVDDGCPEGDRAQLPETPQFVDGWRIGKPDAVFAMPEAFTVPAEGVVDYQYFMIDPELKEDVWLAEAEARPSNPSVVHHIVLFAVGPEVKVRRDEEAQALGQMIAVYAPGMPPWKYPAGTAMKIRAGSKLFIQMHYTPDGREQQDRSQVGLKFADPASVKHKAVYGMAVNSGFEIPPHADNHEVMSKVTFTRDMLLLNLFPHMHYRGKSFRFEAVYSDGRRETLLDVPCYDFNWQLRYDLAEPKLLPKGTALVCTGHFDNSENNPSNPDPTQPVRFGMQTWEEMLVGYYTIVPQGEDPPKRTKKKRE